ncbi:MAG TPA: hypothetical protein PKK60_00090 [archaeon]|nr:hypothetical protein [archaeon]
MPIPIKPKVLVYSNPIKKPMANRFPVKMLSGDKLKDRVRERLLTLRVNPTERVSLKKGKVRTSKERLEDRQRNKSLYQKKFGGEGADKVIVDFLKKSRTNYLSTNELCREIIGANPSLSRTMVEARVRVGIAAGKITDFRAANNPYKHKGFVPGK